MAILLTWAVSLAPLLLLYCISSAWVLVDSCEASSCYPSFTLFGEAGWGLLLGKYLTQLSQFVPSAMMKFLNVLRLGESQEIFLGTCLIVAQASLEARLISNLGQASYLSF